MTAVADAPARPVGAWRATARCWRSVLAVVVVHAAVQAALVAGDPVATVSAGFAARLAASLLAVVVAGWLLAERLSGAVAGGSRRPRPGRLVRWLVGVLVVGAAAVVHPLLAVPAVLGVLPWLVGTRGRARGRRVLGAAVVTVLALALLEVAALLLGFLVTGVAAAAATWLVSGLVAAPVLGTWCRATA